VQRKLFDARPDYTRFDEAAHADPGNPWLVWAVYLAHRLGEARGWRTGIRFAVRRGLTIVLSQHAEGDSVRYSEMFPALRALDISVERVADVLAEMGCWSTIAGRPSKTGCSASSTGLPRDRP
jgi:hypothetical protein